MTDTTPDPNRDPMPDPEEPGIDATSDPETADSFIFEESGANRDDEIDYLMRETDDGRLDTAEDLVIEVPQSEIQVVEWFIADGHGGSL